MILFKYFKIFPLLHISHNCHQPATAFDARKIFRVNRNKIVPIPICYLNWTTRGSRKPMVDGKKLRHSTCSTQIFLAVLYLTHTTPSNPIALSLFHSRNFSSVSGRIEVPQVTFLHLLGDGNFTSSQHTKIARRRSTTAKVSSELAEYFAAGYRNCRSPIAFS